METNMISDSNIYSVLPPKRPTCIAIIKYNLEGNLVNIKFNDTSTAEFKRTLLECVPMVESKLRTTAEFEGSLHKIKDIDLSFSTFWNIYGYKVGNKRKATQLWNEMKEADRLLALAYIRSFKKWSRQKNIELPYPTTYLNQTRWENVLPV